MIVPTQQIVNEFYERAYFNPDLYPYMQTDKNFGPVKVGDCDWSRVVVMNRNQTALLCVSISRGKDNDFSISLFSENELAAGKCVKFIHDLIHRYDPKSISTCVHESNKRSIKINKRLFGLPWGVEKDGAWNMLKGKYENLLHFKKILR